MPTCPNGHQSGSDDWCEVCGHRMAGAVPPPPPPPPPAAGGHGFPPPAGAGAPGARPPAAAAPEPELCPQCRTPREGGAPFCEECRWNFLTNTATSYTPPAPRPPQPRFQPPSATYGGGEGYEYQGSRPSQVNRPAEPIPSFGSEPSGPTPFGGERARSGPPTSPGPSGPPGFGAVQGPGQGPNSGAPSGFGGQSAGQGPGGPSGFGGGQIPGQTSGQGQGPGPGAPAPAAPPSFGRGPASGPGDPFGREPSAPGAPTPPGPPQGGPGAPGPTGFGGDPSRPVPPPPGPVPPAGPGGAPQAFQQPGPPAPPAFPGESGRPAAGGGPSFGGGDDDWVISPPSSAGPAGPAQGQVPGSPGGGYGYPQAPYAEPTTWTATIGPDREYFMAMMQRSGPEAAGLNLPAYSPEQQRTLSGNQITIGRRRHSTGDTPDIDLAVPAEDPGVSHQHAVLVQQPNGSWAVVDQNSTNGTTVNMSEEPIQPFVPVPLQDGDRVHVGAWTTITVRRG
ncbi:FHA domain-containing protein [Streptomyces broussonetiae]|uniref:FHA domain-containing protein n=1 Tax=Streptomyces broussonetiae TaxID=2686304 RepID=A0A6I6N2C9_9ACTN|nr:FHA domain-containing protein [Streptomyces broussonetiae]QHA04779.1 FHA domain-containing protein [Streptomyces broussonetiae]